MIYFLRVISMAYFLSELQIHVFIECIVVPFVIFLIQYCFNFFFFQKLYEAELIISF